MTLAQTTSSSNNQQFEYNQAAFYPVDGQLLGSSSPGTHNRYFSMEVRQEPPERLPQTGMLNWRLPKVHIDSPGTHNRYFIMEVRRERPSLQAEPLTGFRFVVISPGTHNSYFSKGVRLKISCISLLF